MPNIHIMLNRFYFSSERRHYNLFPDFTPSSDASHLFTLGLFPNLNFETLEHPTYLNIQKGKSTELQITKWFKEGT